MSERTLEAEKEARWAERERDWADLIENFDPEDKDHLRRLFWESQQAGANEYAWAHGWPRALTGLASLSREEMDSIARYLVTGEAEYQPTLPFPPMYPEPPMQTS